MNQESVPRSTEEGATPLCDETLSHHTAEHHTNANPPTSEARAFVRQRSYSNGSTFGAFYQTRAISEHAMPSVAQRDESCHFAELSQGIHHELPFGPMSMREDPTAAVIRTLPHQNEFFPSHTHCPTHNSTPALHPVELLQVQTGSNAINEEDVCRPESYRTLWRNNEEHHGHDSSFQMPYPSPSNSLYYSESNIPLEFPVNRSYGASSIAKRAANSVALNSEMDHPDWTYATEAITYARLQDLSLYGTDFAESTRDVQNLKQELSPPHLLESPRVCVPIYSSMVPTSTVYQHSPVHDASFARKQPINNIVDRVYSADSSAETPGTNGSEFTKTSAVTDVTHTLTFFQRVLSMIDLTHWLANDAILDENTGLRYYSENRNAPVASFIRHCFYNPLSPEFTSLQQFDWAVALGVFMGIFTAYWKWLIEAGLEIVWVTLPQKFLAWGMFTTSDGAFPIHHYMWMTPALFGGILSYLFAVLQCPDQNQWISSVHARGIQRYDTFFSLFFLSTLGMWSGMSLGPELPLVLLGGMVGSRLALATKQSVLQARVMNLTAASAAVSGFFGFPMAGALFVLELPHRMGLQYFEALSPATISSIVAVLANRLVTGNDVTGYYRYPWLETTLPSSIFTYAIVYGFYGSVIGILYVFVVKRFKSIVHDGLRDTANKHPQTTILPPTDAPHGDDESTPLVSNIDETAKVRRESSLWQRLKFLLSRFVEHDPTRAACAGTLAGATCGLVGIFLPHTMFWGEAQLQNLIDKGRTQLPVFGSSSKLTAFAYCMIDPNDEDEVRAGFGIGCAAMISLAKAVVVGLSLGTGIIGGQFWGPLFVGCAASHLFTDAIELFRSYFGFGGGLATHPCVIVLCTMAASHVVTFRAHMAIMLILTLTISAFNPESESNMSSSAGDYSAVFPLLVVASFVSLMASRDTVVYGTQRSRGDITAVPEVLCRPGMEGMPMVVDYDNCQSENSSDGSEHKSTAAVEHCIAPERFETMSDDKKSTGAAFPDAVCHDALLSARLDEILQIGPSLQDGKSLTHKRTHSAPSGDQADTIAISPINGKISARGKNSPGRGRSNSGGSQKGLLVRVSSFGNVQDLQPSLLEQARHRSSSSAGADSKHRRIPSLPTDPKTTREHHHARSSSLILNVKY